MYDVERFTMSNSPVVSDQLAARVRITQLLDEFSGRVDRGSSVADLLEERSRFVTPVWNAEGRDEIAKKLLALAEDRKEKGREARHITATVNTEEIGAGRFRVRSLMIVLMQADANGGLTIGEHDDIVSIDAKGSCRFVERSMKPALKFALSAQ